MIVTGLPGQPWTQDLVSTRLSTASSDLYAAADVHAAHLVRPASALDVDADPLGIDIPACAAALLAVCAAPVQDIVEAKVPLFRSSFILQFFGAMLDGSDIMLVTEVRLSFWCICNGRLVSMAPIAGQLGSPQPCLAPHCYMLLPASLAVLSTFLLYLGHPQHLHAQLHCPEEGASKEAFTLPTPWLLEAWGLCDVGVVLCCLPADALQQLLRCSHCSCLKLWSLSSCGHDASLLQERKCVLRLHRPCAGAAQSSTFIHCQDCGATHKQSSLHAVHGWRGPL